MTACALFFNGYVFSWHRELRVGNSSELLFRRENQMFGQFPKGSVCVQTASCTFSMSSDTFSEKSASAILYIQNLFQGYVG